MNSLSKFKKATESNWRQARINPKIYGFQFQAGTRWYPGLSNSQINQFEDMIGFRFPNDYRVLQREMNGTDLPTINKYGYSGEPIRESVGEYSYPRDLNLVRQLVTEERLNRPTLIKTMAEQGFTLSPSDSLLPIFGHRYLVCASKPDSSSVLSIWHANDAIVYGSSLQDYLRAEFLAEL